MRHPLSLVRARASMSADDPARRRAGAEVLAALRTLADAVTDTLPELTSLARFASRSSAARCTVGWHAPNVPLASAPRLSFTLQPRGLDVTFGYGRPSAHEIPRAVRDRHLAEGMRRRRAHAESLGFRLAALRTEGAKLYARHGDDTVLAEDEWLRLPAGVVVFAIAEAALDATPVLTRLVADRVARLAALGAALGSFVFEPSPAWARDARELREAARSLRWDERALGEGAPPVGLVPIARRVAYDPVTGWFAPERMCLTAPTSAVRSRFLLDLGATPTGSVATSAGTLAPVSAGLHARLVRWMAARGHTTAQRDVAHIELRVAAASCSALGERPVLESLVAAVLEDPSGDTATALAGLLAGAPWRAVDALDPTRVASKVSSRHAASAARGVARLCERGLLTRDATGTLGAVGECITHAAVRPVLVLAIERALGHLDVVPPDARLALEGAAARPWEVAATAPRAATLESVARRFVAYARASGLSFDLDLVRGFVVGLRTRPFAVLAGVSGTGKTALAQGFARYMTDGLPEGSAPRVAIVPVRPDWIDSRGLLGYLHALHGSGAYEDTAALRVMLRAAEHPDEAHFIVLDEMNLARVEHYLAEVLSAMESGAPVPLHGRAEAVVTTDGARKIPPSLTLTSNLFILGTVNLDETTHVLSPKVLDRAWLWEFGVSPPTALLREWLGERRAALPAGDDERRALLESGTDGDPVRALVLAMGRDGAGRRLDRLFDIMARGGKPFGYRTTTEALRFIELCEREAIETSAAWRLDRAVLGKVLPRLSGTRRELEPLLRALIAECDGDDGGHYARTVEPPHEGVADRAPRPEGSEALRASAAKLREMLSRLDREAFVSFSR